MMPFKSITKTGGLISCLEIEIKEIIERKVLLRINNFKKVVNENNLENEIEKLQFEVEKSNVLVEKSSIKKFIVCKGNNDIKITIWDFDVSVGRFYRIINVKIDNGIGFFCSTTKNSVIIEKMIK
ncbi:hypothetical protein DMUE_1961 [Dictyocoela muelleri]|nr:hypothetical protein DMUE_1961 [Dictyocoela muelleri]